MGHRYSGLETLAGCAAERPELSMAGAPEHQPPGHFCGAVPAGVNGGGAVPGVDCDRGWFGRDARPGLLERTVGLGPRRQAGVKDGLAGRCRTR